MTQDPFLSLRHFARAIELGSLRAVAREYGVEPSSISRSLTNLEARLAVQLLDRSQAKSRPTSAGQVYYAKLRHLLSQLDGLEADIRGERDVPSGLLKVNASIDFGQQHVAAWLLDFKDLYPKVEVELTLSARRVDIVAQGIDLAIRIGQQPDSSLVTRKLADNHRVIVASSDYLARKGTPMVPKDLEHHDYVHFLPGSRTTPLELIGPEGTLHKVQRSGGVTIDAIAVIVEAVKRGHGVHTGPRWAFQSALDAGEVVQVLPAFTAVALPIYATWAPAVFLPARVRAFVDFAANRAKLVPGLSEMELSLTDLPD